MFNAKSGSHLSVVVGEPIDPPGKLWALQHVLPDACGQVGSTAWLFNTADAVGRNLAKHTARVLVDRLAPLTWPERQGESPFGMTFAVARCLIEGGKVRALEVLADVTPADRALFMTRLAAAMGDATRGVEHQL